MFVSLISPLYLLIGLLASDVETATSKWVIQEDSKVTILGNSNVNSFECSLEGIRRRDTVEFENDLTRNILFLRDGLIKIKTKDFDCKNPLLTEDFYTTLKADKYPYIVIKLVFLDFDPDDVWIKEKVKGRIEITIGGVVDTYDIDFIPEPADENILALAGENIIYLHDFNLKPPRKLFGLIKVDDRIKVLFNLKLSRLS